MQNGSASAEADPTSPPSQPAFQATPASPAVGLVYAVLAYLSWGFIALYFKQLQAVPPLLVLGHRVIWSVAFLAILLVITGQLRDVIRCFLEPRTLLVLLASTLMIACNWFTFIYAVSEHHLVEASFGYFMNPLVNVLLGVVVLKERLRAYQLIAIALACCGVGVMGMMAYQAGATPIISILLAFSFGFYGLLRKVAPVGPLVGLSVETVLLFPIAIAYVLLNGNGGLDGWLRFGPSTAVLLALGGMVTAIPLLWFAAAARRLRLATVGFLQYLAPTCQLLLAVLAFGEPFTHGHLLSFAFIWSAIGVFTADAIRNHRKGRPPKFEVMPPD